MKDWEGDEAPAVGMAVKCRVVHATGLQGTGSVCVMCVCVSCVCMFLCIMCIICVCMRVSCVCVFFTPQPLLMTSGRRAGHHDFR